MRLAADLRGQLRNSILAAVPPTRRQPVQHLLGSYGPLRNPEDGLAIVRFLTTSGYALRQKSRWQTLIRLIRVSFAVKCYHTHNEMLQIATEILSLDRQTDGCIVEAGCFKGGSTSKLSIAASLAGRRLFVFDSFAGLPENDEDHGFSKAGRKIDFGAGQYAGALDEVKSNVQRYGALDVCEFVPGWFSRTMPDFDRPIAVAFIDVDLVSSTKDCLRYLWPLVIPGGAIYSQDGHLPLVAKLLDDDQFWEDELGVSKPVIKGLFKRKLVRIGKPG